MKTIALSNGMACLINDEDFDRVSAFRWHPNKARQSSINHYAYTSVDGRSTSMHRLIMGAAKGVEVDHVNGNGLDNRRSNLRICTRSQNCANQARPRGASGFIGVFKAKQRWQAAIGSSRSERIFLGTFDTPEEAARVRDRAAREHFGDFARLNFPEEHA